MRLLELHRAVIVHMLATYASIEFRSSKISYIVRICQFPGDEKDTQKTNIPAIFLSFFSLYPSAVAIYAHSRYVYLGHR